MKIICQKSKYHRFALYYDYSMDRVDFCRQLKESFGWEKFSFSVDGTLKFWAFSDSILISVLAEKFPEVDISSEVYQIINQEQAWQNKQVKQNSEIDKIRVKEKTDFSVKGLKLPLYEYQKVGVEFLVMAKGRAIIADSPGCIAGDEKIIINRGGNGRTYSMREAFDRYGKTWRTEIPSMTRSLTADGIFKLNKISKILYKGIKKTLILEAETDDGEKYSLKLTQDHKISTPTGWKRLGILKVGDQITVNGKHMEWCSVCGKVTEHAVSEYTRKYNHSNYGKCKNCIYRFIRKNHTTKNIELESGEHLDKGGYVYVSKLYFHPKTLNSRKKYTSIFKHILVYEAFKNDISYEEWIEMCSKNRIPEGSFFVDSAKYAIHHKDSDRRNNTIGNLELLTHAAHAALNGENNIRNIKKFILPNIAVVTKISNGGKTDVYDIVMSGVNRNFIVNGIVVHNCGKTSQALAFSKHMKFKRVLIVAPASVKFAWESEVKKWTNMSSIVIDSNTDISSIDSDINFWIINYDVLKKHFNQLSKIRFCSIIGDECQYIKSISAIRTKAFRALSRDIGSVVLLSGTPLLSRPSELFSLLNIIDQKNWSDWYQFARRYCAMKQTQWGMDTSGASNIGELHDKIKRYFIRRDKSQVLKELPPKTFVSVPVKLDKPYSKEYDEVAEDLAKYLRDNVGMKTREVEKSMSAEKLVQLNLLRRLCAMGKIKTTIELIESIINAGEKVLVFSSFIEPLNELHAKFKKESVMITGATDVNLRGDIVSSFQKDPKIKVFLGGYKSAGTGITLTAAQNFIGIDFPWNPADLQQSIDRLHRPGQVANNVNIYQLKAMGTVDEDMETLLDTKQGIFDMVIDGKKANINAGTAMKSALTRVANNY